MTFDWERIEDFERVTGIDPLDKALAYLAPEGLLKQHLERREGAEGREAVIADLEAITAATSRGSPAHDGCAAWLERYRSGVPLSEL